MSGLRGTLWPPIDQSTATEMSQPLGGSAHWPFSLKLINLATLPFCCQSSKPKCHKKTGTLAADGEGESNWAMQRLGSRKFRLRIRTRQHVGMVQKSCLIIYHTFVYVCFKALLQPFSLALVDLDCFLLISLSLPLLRSSRCREHFTAICRAEDTALWFPFNGSNR